MTPKDIPGTGGMADDDRRLVMTAVLIVAEDYKGLCLYTYTLSHSFLGVILLFLRSCVPSPYSNSQVLAFLMLDSNRNMKLRAKGKKRKGIERKFPQTIEG